MDRDDDEIRHVLGSGHCLDHRWSVISVPHPGRVGGGVPAVIGGDSSEADHSHLPTVDVVQRRLPGFVGVPPGADRPDPGGEQLVTAVDQRLLAEVAGMVVSEVADVDAVGLHRGKTLWRAAEHERLVQGRAQVGWNALEIDHSEVIIQEQPVQPRPGVIPPLGGEGRYVLGVGGHVPGALDHQISLLRDGGGCCGGDGRRQRRGGRAGGDAGGSRRRGLHGCRHRGRGGRRIRAQTPDGEGDNAGEDATDQDDEKLQGPGHLRSKAKSLRAFIGASCG